MSLTNPLLLHLFSFILNKSILSVLHSSLLFSQLESISIHRKVHKFVSNGKKKQSFLFLIDYLNIIILFIFRHIIEINELILHNGR
jgi:ABC-type uncharacterized transport system permease subunit